MKKGFILLGFLYLVVTLLPACAPEPAAREAPSTEADLAALEAVKQQCLEAVNGGDAKRVVGFCTDDHVWIPADERILIGKEALRESFQAMFDTYEYAESWSSEEVVVSGDWAFDRGTFTATLTPKAGGEPIQDGGRYIWILKRQADGSWKYARSIWNRGAPPPEEPTP
jgi:uncharacterized protein (TIGR02246 family)